MSDSVGLVDLPVAVPTVTPPEERARAPGDPALAVLGAFVAAVLQNDIGDAWAALSPGKPDQPYAIDGEALGTGPVRHAWYSNPRSGHFSPEDLPGVFVFRMPQATVQWAAADAQRLRSQIAIAWMMPRADENPQRRERDPFFHAALASLHQALTQRRHRSWVLDADLAAADGLKTSFATALTEQTITTFNGALAGATMKAARPISVTTGAAVGAYNTTDPIVVTGLLEDGASFIERIYLTQANGGETVPTIFPFGSPTSVVLPAMLTTTGTLTIGYDDSPEARNGSLVQRACGFREMRLTRATTQPIQVRQPDGTQEPFEAIELLLEVAEDGLVDLDLRAFSPWDIEAHGRRDGADVFEFVIED